MKKCVYTEDIFHTVMAMSSVHHIVPAAYALLQLRHAARGTVPTDKEVLQALKDAKTLTDDPVHPQALAKRSLITS